MYAYPLHSAVQTRHSAPGPYPALPARAEWGRFLERAGRAHPVLTLAGALLLTGAGMVTAVTLVAISVALPVGLLLGWV